jgi:hypothetical protein
MVVVFSSSAGYPSRNDAIEAQILKELAELIKGGLSCRAGAKADMPLDMCTYNIYIYVYIYYNIT